MRAAALDDCWLANNDGGLGALKNERPRQDNDADKRHELIRGDSVSSISRLRQTRAGSSSVVLGRGWNNNIIILFIDILVVTRLGPMSWPEPGWSTVAHVLIKQFFMLRYSYNEEPLSAPHVR